MIQITVKNKKRPLISVLSSSARPQADGKLNKLEIELTKPTILYPNDLLKNQQKTPCDSKQQQCFCFAKK